MYNTTADAKTAMYASGVVEWFYEAWFDGDDELFDRKMGEVYEFMWRNDVTPLDAAKHFEVD